jgi:Rrf2 family nitric oxide-sensitive transcriptional repressor
MQLTLHSDYALRVLIYLGTHPGELVSTQTMSDAYGISKHHLVRVVQTLGEHGYVKVVPGRSGGVGLARAPESIRLGDVVVDAEQNMRLVECFDMGTNTCPIVQHCGLKRVLNDALLAFVASLNTRTLADLLSAERRKALKQTFVRLQR